MHFSEEKIIRYKVFFSIILPTYNRVDMLPRAIRSVIGQSFRDWELIIIDDGSTDDTSAVVKEFNDSRIIYIYQENAERSIARNRGIDQASGKYICFLDSDDYYLPNHLKAFFNTISERQEPKAFLFCNLFNEKNEIFSLPEKCEEYEYKNDIEYVVQHIISTPQACIHSQILKDHKFNPTLFIGEDLNLWIRILLDYPLIECPDKTLVMSLHEGRTVNVHLRNIYKYHLAAFRLTIKDPAIKNKISNKIRRSMYCESYFGMGKYYIFQKKKWRAFIMIFMSWLFMPKYQLKFKLNLMYCLLFDYQKAMRIVM
jgi:glycosyltransferase involved in cell wall biosynthesis